MFLWCKSTSLWMSAYFCLVIWLSSLFITHCFASLMASTQARIHVLSLIFPTNDRINSAPFLLPKSTFLVGSNALNFAFKVPNAFSTGASSGLYGAKNLTSNGSFSTHCFVSLDQCVGALSIRAIGISDVCKFSFLNKSSSSLKNMQNIFEFAVFCRIIPNHLQSLQVASMSQARPLNLSLRMG